MKAVKLSDVNNETYERLAGCRVNEAAVALYYRNLKSDEPFIPGFNSLDYSLQMAMGVAAWNAWTQKSYPEVSKANSRNLKLKSFSVDMSRPVKIPLLPAEEAFRRGD
ncbi:hypothetical protein [Pseudomonas frederiksbergensis]|uniref:hypothetical protein n=1 Tax=Pseudomonas frederiksbergensis TaxID=104087 RepID=UPI0012EB3332|nr:hypothetical protein [Pseudomonas frederiksbergensis]